MHYQGLIGSIVLAAALLMSRARDWPEYQEPLLTRYSIGKWIDEAGNGR